MSPSLIASLTCLIADGCCGSSQHKARADSGDQGAEIQMIIRAVVNTVHKPSTQTGHSDKQKTRVTPSPAVTDRLEA